MVMRPLPATANAMTLNALELTSEFFGVACISNAAILGQCCVMLGDKSNVRYCLSATQDLVVHARR